MPDVQEFLARYLDALDRRDSAAIKTAYVSDGRFTWLEDGRVRYRTAEEVLRGLGELPKGAGIRTALMGLSVVPVGSNGAHAWATFKTTIGAPPDGLEFGGALTFILERRGQTWVIVGGHSSTTARRH